MPIEDPTQIDVVYRDTEGAPVLVISDSGNVASPDQRTAAFVAKLKSYAGYLTSDQFRRDYDAASPADVSIKLVTATPPNPQMNEIIERGVTLADGTQVAIAAEVVPDPERALEQVGAPPPEPVAAELVPPGETAGAGEVVQAEVAPAGGHGPAPGGQASPSSSVSAPSPAHPVEKVSPQFAPVQKLYERITAEAAKLYVGQDELVLGTLAALFSGGHVLIESVPGLGKTLFVRTLGRILGCEFGRIQFTADLMPSDITGAPVFDMQRSEFRFRPGPVFTQLLLADEINRSPAKTHAALLEIMQEYRVTIDGTSHRVPRPFLVLATQNPLESEGTYNLPEAQLDRFMFKLRIDYPTREQEAEILKLHSLQVDLNRRLEEEVRPVTTPEQVQEVISLCGAVRVEDSLVDYINQVVRATRNWPAFHIGASPRAGIALMQSARTLAAFHGRDFATPDDVVEIALPTLRHRVQLTAEAEIEGRETDEELRSLIRGIEVPRD